MLIPRRYNDVIKCPEKHFYQSIKRHAPLRTRNADSTGFMGAVGFEEPKSLMIFCKIRGIGEEILFCSLPHV
jgi:hypothetical protein